MYFDLGKWFGKSFSSTYDFKELYYFVSSRNSYNEYVKSEKKFSTFDKNGEKRDLEFTDENVVLFTESGFLDVNKSLILLLNMVIVYQSSIIDGIIKDSFKAIFINDPIKMKYINNKNNLEYSINLDTIIESTSKNDLMERLAEDNASICSSGKIKIVLRRLNELTGKKLDLEILARIENIVLKRNEIIHELKELNIGITEIETIHKRVTDFLINISEYFESIGICVYDPAMLITKYHTE